MAERASLTHLKLDTTSGSILNGKGSPEHFKRLLKYPPESWKFLDLGLFLKIMYYHPLGLPDTIWVVVAGLKESCKKLTAPYLSAPG